eukprot:6439103-Pyramimonas_sp.AAC.1
MRLCSAVSTRAPAPSPLAAKAHKKTVRCDVLGHCERARSVAVMHHASKHAMSCVLLIYGEMHLFYILVFAIVLVGGLRCPSNCHP